MLEEKIFAEGVAREIKSCLAPEFSDVECTVVEQRKNNNVILTGVCFHRQGQRADPIVYVEPFYDEVKNGRPKEEAMKEMAKLAEKGMEIKEIPKADKVLAYGKAKEYLCVRIVNTKANRKRLTQMPHQELEDLSLTLALCFPLDAKPNLLQANTSFVVLDPKGENLRDTGHLLEAKGYEVRVLDLINMEKSHCYNPFVYLKDDNDVQRLVTNLFKATTPKGSQSNDPFWDTAASMLLLALIFYLKYEAPKEEQNFPMVMELLRAGEVREDNDEYQSPLDELFERLEMREPEHIAVKYYKDYHSGSAKTLKSIQITLAARLEKFNLRSLAALTATDDLDLPALGEKKVALFALIPDNDTSYNFLVSVLYTQLFQQLFYLADHKYGGRLPVHVHFLMDEFANVSLPDDFDKILSVMRSREVSVSIILQNLAQLKALFEKQWESICGNCDEFLYLGGNEQGTHKYVSELLGKSTIDTNTYGKSTGHSSNYSTNYQNTGRELLTPDEVRMLDNRYAILFIRGERPVLDEKFDILKHPNVALSTDGKGKPYRHGEVTQAVAGIMLGDSLADEIVTDEPDTKGYELLSEEDLETIYHQTKEDKNND